jgi:hypothetical protein
MRSDLDNDVMVLAEDWMANLREVANQFKKQQPPAERSSCPF